MCTHRARHAHKTAGPPEGLTPGNAPYFSVQTLKHEGLRGLFKGMAAPLATVALFNAVLFATRGQMELLLQHEDGAQASEIFW